MVRSWALQDPALQGLVEHMQVITLCHMHIVCICAGDSQSYA